MQNTAGVGLWSIALRQELIQQLQALGFKALCVQLRICHTSHWPHRGLRVSADAVAVSNDLHSCSRPQAILKVRPPNSLDYRVRYEPQPLNSLELTRIDPNAL